MRQPMRKFVLGTRLSSVSTESNSPYHHGDETHHTTLRFENGVQVKLISSNGSLHNEFSARMAAREEFEIEFRSKRKKS